MPSFMSFLFKLFKKQTLPSSAIHEKESYHTYSPVSLIFGSEKSCES